MSDSMEKRVIAGPSDGAVAPVTLFQAVSSNMLSVARALLEKGADPNAHAEDPLTTPLIKATAMGNIEMMQLLVDNGAYAYLCDHRGNTPLHWAARQGNLAAVALLCEIDNTTKAENMNHQTPIMEACACDHFDVVQYLAWREAIEEVQPVDESGSTLVSASSMARGIISFALGRKDTIRVADVRGEGSEGDEPRTLFQAIINKDIATMKRLLEGGADPNDDDDGESWCPPLHLAAYKGDQEALRLLLEHGASVSYTDKTLNTVLHCAATKDHLMCVKMRGARPDVANLHGRTPLDRAVRYSQIKVARCLIFHGAGGGFKMNEGNQSALALASAQGDYELAKFILETDCPSTSRSRCLQVALECATLSGHILLLRLLLMHGADINHSDGFTDPPIFAAVYARRVPVLQYLMSNGANVEQRNRGDWTPLMLAVKIGAANVVSCLLAAGANANAKTKHGMTVFSIANDLGDEEICEQIIGAIKRCKSCQLNSSF